MSERDDDVTKGARVEEEESVDVPAVSEDDAREVDAGVRALRDEPVAAERLARMRVGLDARIAATEDAEAGDGAQIVPIESHPRWGRRAAAAAAIAAAVLLALLLGRSGDRPAERAPVQVADDAPTPGSGDGSLDEEPETRLVETPDEAIALPRDDVPATEIAESPAPPAPDALVVDAPTDPVPADLEDASDEELQLAIEYERLTDYDVIAQLDLLELLDEMEAEGRI